jgi:hypothetical protein
MDSHNIVNYNIKEYGNHRYKLIARQVDYYEKIYNPSLSTKRYQKTPNRSSTKKNHNDTEGVDILIKVPNKKQHEFYIYDIIIFYKIGKMVLSFEIEYFYIKSIKPNKYNNRIILHGLSCTKNTEWKKKIIEVYKGEIHVYEHSEYHTISFTNELPENKKDLLLLYLREKTEEYNRKLTKGNERNIEKIKRHTLKFKNYKHAYNRTYKNLNPTFYTPDVKPDVKPEIKEYDDDLDRSESKGYDEDLHRSESKEYTEDLDTREYNEFAQNYSYAPEKVQYKPENDGLESKVLAPPLNDAFDPKANRAAT